MMSKPFLTDENTRRIAREFGTPVFVYDQGILESQSRQVLRFSNAFGLTVRYAMKACPTRAVLKVVTNAGIQIDASSGHEVERALLAGIPAANIQLTAQQLPDNLKELVEKGMLFNACSIAQIEAFGLPFPNRELSIRVNPGLGSGHSNRTNVGGPSAGFGIWHEHLDEAIAVGSKYGLRFTRLHTHIGSGSDPRVWQRVALMALDTCARLPDVKVLSLGGGFKVGRMPGEQTTDMQEIGALVAEAFRSFATRHGRQLHLEIEPGTYLVANAGALIAQVIDLVDTGQKGYQFIKVDAGMTETLRPSLYGAQHPIWVVSATSNPLPGQEKCVVIGHCCESGDVLTPSPGNSDALEPRTLQKARVGDLLVVGGAGAYCSAMAAKNYNSFPEAPEVMILPDGSAELIRKRQTLDQVLQNEVAPSQR